MLYFIESFNFEHVSGIGKKHLMKSSAHMKFFDLCKKNNLPVKRLKLLEVEDNTAFICELFVRTSIYELIEEISTLSEILPEFIFKKLQENKCLLLLSDCHESYDVEEKTYKKINVLLQNANIKNKCIIIFNNSWTRLPIFDTGNNITTCRFNYFESVARNQFNINNINKIKTTRFNNIFLQNIKHKFICLNRMPRGHRVLFLLLLQRENLLNDFLWSLPDINVDDIFDKKTFTLNEVWSDQERNFVHNGTTSIERKQFNTLLPSVVDVSKFTNNHWNTLNDQFITSTGIYVVTETLFSGDNTNCFFTEKIFKPIFYKMPFIVVGTSHFLQYLHQSGYKTYNSIWCEDYDLCQNDIDRLLLIVKLIKSINKLTQTEFSKLLLETAYINAYNYTRLMCSDSDNIIIQFLKDRFNTFTIP